MQVVAFASARRGGTLAGQEAGEETFNRRLEDGEGGADDADVDFEESPAVGFGLIDWVEEMWVS